MIGLFIGSFNPPTKAHIDICVNLKDRFSKIVLVPVNNNEKDLIDLDIRIEILNIIKHTYNFLEITNIMKDYAYLNYKVIDLLKNEYGDLNIIMGSDLLEKLDSFENYEYLLSNYSYTIIPRGNSDVLKLINDKYKKYQDKFSILDYHSDTSSTLVKELLKENKDTKDFLDSDIYSFIREQDLY